MSTTTKTIFVLGPPASGKSTFIGYLVEEIKSAGCGADGIKIIKDTELLKIVCPKTTGNPDYYYEGEKLIFSSSAREKIIGRLLTKTADKINIAQNKFPWCIVEFTHPNWEWALDNFFDKKLLANSILVFLNSPRKLLFSHNQNRPVNQQVPVEYLETFIKEENSVFPAIRNKFKLAFVVDNQKTKGSLKKQAENIANF